MRISVAVTAWGLLGALPILVSACDKEPTTSVHYERDGATDASMGVDVLDAPPLGYDLHQADRSNCSTFGAGSLVEDSIGPEVPHGSQLPFHHVVFLVQENRSFDHYLSKLNEDDTLDASINLDDAVDTANDAVTNPSGPGSPVPEIERQLEAFPCESDGRDLNHDWEATHIQYDNGLLDGFVVTNAPGGARLRARRSSARKLVTAYGLTDPPPGAPHDPSCAQVDVESNDSLITSDMLATNACRGMKQGMMAGPSDVDYYAYSNSTSATCNGAPTVTPSDNVRVCVFPVCNVGATITNGCKQGKSVFLQSGPVGCCADVGQPAAPNTFECTDQTSQAASTVYIRVDIGAQSSTDNSACKPYTLSYTL